MDNAKLHLPISTEGSLNAVPSGFYAKTLTVKNPMRFIIIAVLFMAIVLSLVIWIISPPNPDVLYDTWLADDQKETIRSCFTSKYTDYPGKIVRWSYVDPYYGTINNCIVFIVHSLGTAGKGAWHQEIANYTFEWDHPIDLFVYRNVKYPYESGLCTLEEAYENGWLTEKQIGEIHKKHVEYRANFPQMLEDWNKSHEQDE